MQDCKGCESRSIEKSLYKSVVWNVLSLAAEVVVV